MFDFVNTQITDEMLTFVVFLFGYLIYFFSYESKVTKKLAKKIGDQEERKEFAIHLPRILGFLLLGIVPFILIELFYTKKPFYYGFTFPRGEYALIISICSIAIFLLGCILRSGKKIDTDFYPQVRVSKWNQKEHLFNIVSWSLYLLGYEFIIRGVMFFSCVYAYGLVSAIIINSVIYSLIHIFKGKQEAYGAFPLGIVLCLIAYYTQSMVLPFVIHVILAVSNDLKAIKISSNNTNQIDSHEE